MESLKIGEVATRAGVSNDTLRYYEKRGLIAAPRRVGSGAYRHYAPAVVERVLFIKEAQELGFTLADVAELLRLKDAPEARCADMRAQADEKLREIEAKIARLVDLRNTLEDLVEACANRADAPLSECPIIEALEHGHEG